MKEKKKRHNLTILAKFKQRQLDAQKKKTVNYQFNDRNPSVDSSSNMEFPMPISSFSMV